MRITSEVLSNGSLPSCVSLESVVLIKLLSRCFTSEGLSETAY
jgi:hypothetical protein